MSLLTWRMVDNNRPINTTKGEDMSCVEEDARRVMKLRVKGVVKGENDGEHEESKNNGGDGKTV